MNAAQAKKISILDLLASLGHSPVDIRKSGNEAWYRSPFRSETEPSFKIRIDQNIWYDFGEGEGGNIIDFVMKYNRVGFTDALSFLGNKIIKPTIIPPTATNAKTQHEMDFFNIESPLIHEIKPIYHFALKNYLRERCIAQEISFKYLKEISYKVDDKNYFALGFPNTSGGWEVRNPLFKGCLGKKDLSLIENGSEKVSVFEGFFDYLSCLTISGKMDMSTDVIVLNSTSMKKKGIDIVKNNKYKQLDAYFDNDTGGMKTLERFKMELSDVNITAKNHLYEPFKDFNESLINRSIQQDKKLG